MEFGKTAGITIRHNAKTKMKNKSKLKLECVITCGKNNPLDPGLKDMIENLTVADMAEMAGKFEKWSAQLRAFVNSHAMLPGTTDNLRWN